MLSIIMKRLALSSKGAKDFLRGTFFTTLLNIALMLPALYIFLFLDEYLQSVINPSHSGSKGIAYYACLGVLFMLITWVIARLQYRQYLYNDL